MFANLIPLKTTRAKLFIMFPKDGNQILNSLKETNFTINHFKQKGQAMESIASFMCIFALAILFFEIL
jgi:hypothetical protein